jgi:hypothetical protein
VNHYVVPTSIQRRKLQLNHEVRRPRRRYGGHALFLGRSETLRGNGSCCSLLYICLATLSLHVGLMHHGLNHPTHMRINISPIPKLILATTYGTTKYMPVTAGGSETAGRLRWNVWSSDHPSRTARSTYWTQRLVVKSGDCRRTSGTPPLPMMVLPNGTK